VLANNLDKKETPGARPGRLSSDAGGLVRTFSARRPAEVIASGTSFNFLHARFDIPRDICHNLS
jgi:hypothetical protein